MFESNAFDRFARKVREFEQIIQRTETRLRGLSGTIRNFSNVGQSERLLRNNQRLLRSTIDIGLREVGITRAMADRIRFYTRELELSRRITQQLQAQRAAQTGRDTSTSSRLQQNITDAQRRLQKSRDLETRLSTRRARMASTNPNDPRLVALDARIATAQGRTLSRQGALNGLQQRYATHVASAAQQQQRITDQLQEQVEVERTLNAQREIDRDLMRREQRANLSNVLQNQFAGGFIGSINNLIKAIRGVGIMLTPLLFLGMLVKIILGSLQEGLRKTIELGYDASQRFGEMDKASRIMASSAAKLANLNMADVIEAANSLQTAFGTLEVSGTLVEQSALLSRQLGLSADEAGNLLEYFVRIAQQSDKAAAFSTVLMKATAIGNRANPSTVIRDVLQNTINFAKSGTTAADQMARAAIYTRQIGTNLGTIAQIADRIVTDFEGTLEAQATIGTFAPGFNMSGLMIASQFGSDEDIARELKASIQSLGFDMKTLPRSFKLAISSSLGIPVDELMRIAGAKEPSLQPPTAKDIQTASDNIVNELQQTAAHPLKNLEGMVANIVNLLTRRFFGSSDKDIRMMNKTELLDVIGSGNSRKARQAETQFEIISLQEELNKLNKITPANEAQKLRIEKRKSTIQKQLSSMGMESRAVGGVVGKDKAPKMSLLSLFKNLKSNEVPTILHRGEAVLNKSQMSILGQLTSIQNKIGTSLNSFVGTFSKQISGKDGLVSKISSVFSPSTGSNQSQGLLGKISGIFSKRNQPSQTAFKTSGILNSIGNIFKSKTSRSVPTGGSKQVDSFAKISNILKSPKLSKIPGLGKLAGSLTGKLSSISGIASKIPGLGALSGLLKGGGLKGIGSSLLKMGTSKMIGAAIGSIIPGAGTLLGGVLGSGVGKLFGSLKNSKIGQAASRLLGKTPLGKLGSTAISGAKKALGGIGKKLGGLFGKKKKKSKTTPTVIQPSISDLISSAGLMNFGAGLDIPGMPGINAFGGMMTPNMPVTATAFGQNQMSPISTQAMEQKLDTLISLLKSGAIAINLDGKKVSESLVDANRYG